MEQKSFFMIGAGNVGWHMAKAMNNAGYRPKGIYSLHKENAEALAQSIGCNAYNNLREIPEEADIYIISVKDDAISEIAKQIEKKTSRSLLLHTAGSVDINVLENHAYQWGVLYPMQTFSKHRHVDFNDVNLFAEGCNAETERDIISIAERISAKKCMVLSSEKRKRLHLAAVFASNFVNHCYTIAKQQAEIAGCNFEVLLPLIEETCKKVHDLTPEEAQTGPALRNDRKIIEMHETMMQENILNIYKAISESIFKSTQVHNC